MSGTISGRRISWEKNIRLGRERQRRPCLPFVAVGSGRRTLRTVLPPIDVPKMALAPSSAAVGFSRSSASVEAHPVLIPRYQA